VAERGWKRIGEGEWNEIRSALPDISESTLRDAGIPILQPWRGIGQHTLDELEQSLREFSEIYAMRVDLRRYCRDQVIAAKDRAKWSSRSEKADEEKRRLKSEMADWMLVWLDDPAMFPTWVSARSRML
jgi:hypothetical protein